MVELIGLNIHLLGQLKLWYGVSDLYDQFEIFGVLVKSVFSV